MMLKLTNFVTRPIAAAALLAVCLLPAVSLAAIVQTNTFDETSDVAFTVSATDLVNDGQLTLSGQTSIDSSPGGGAPTNLNNGTSGLTGNIGSGLYDPGNTWSTTFDLDVTGNTLGYDITGVTTYSGWNTGNLSQTYELFVSVVGDGSFTSLGTYTFTPAPITAALNSTRIALTDDTGTLATGVDAVRFAFPNEGASVAAVYRELDVFGVATVIPEPASFALMALGLVGMVSLRKRNRC